MGISNENVSPPIVDEPLALHTVTEIGRQTRTQKTFVIEERDKTNSLNREEAQAKDKKAEQIASDLSSDKTKIIKSNPFGL